MKSALIAAAIPWLAFLAGCGRAPGPVLDLKIADGDWSDYHRSLEIIDARQTPEERREFREALQEMKYQAMLGDHRPSTPQEIGAHVRAQTAGLTVRDVLVLSCTIKLDRKREQEKALVRSITRNKRLRTREGDEASATFLQSVHASQAKDLHALRGEISALVKRINELLPGQIPTPRSPADDGIVPGPELDEAPRLKKTAPADRRKLA